MPPVPAPTDAVDLPWQAQAVLPALVPGACLQRAELLRFGQAMQALGRPVQVQRMRYDRMYAFSCLGQAHALGDAALRDQAMALFARYQG